MDKNEFEFLLYDRIEKIKSIDKQYNLRNNAYISFSGGKDSTILHYLIDMALPNNNIPRLFINTGMEYKDLVNYVKNRSKNDKRIIIYNSNVNIKKMLLKYGYPFKSKQHSHCLSIYYNNYGQPYTKTIQSYLGLINSSTKIKCPKILKYQFTTQFKIHCSDACCTKLKKENAKKWAKENNKSIVLTGMRSGEGGQRLAINCVNFKNGELKKFHPLLVINEEFEKYFIDTFKIKLCKLYYPPFNFNRTGCKGCPFSLNLKKDLEVMEKLLPNERKQCELLWGPIYNEYRKIGYRL